MTFAIHDSAFFRCFHESFSNILLWVCTDIWMNGRKIGRKIRYLLNFVLVYLLILKCSSRFSWSQLTWRAKAINDKWKVTFCAAHLHRMQSLNLICFRTSQHILIVKLSRWEWKRQYWMASAEVAHAKWIRKHVLFLCVHESCYTIYMEEPISMLGSCLSTNSRFVHSAEAIQYCRFHFQWLNLSDHNRNRSTKDLYSTRMYTYYLARSRWSTLILSTC